MAKRKIPIVQIAIAVDDGAKVIVALREDGEIYVCAEGKWRKAPPVPDVESDETLKPSN
jgi:hypothetical protein